jgi:type VI protein secretion system component Hcp
MADQQRFFFLDMKTAGVVPKGGSDKKGHEDWIELDSWDFSMTQTANPNVKGGKPDGTSAMGMFSFTIKHNGPALFGACANGALIQKPITFEADRGGVNVASGNGRKPTATYFRLKFENTVITGRSISGDDTTKTEQISLNFGKVTMEYYQIVDGTPHLVGTKSYNAMAGEAK